AEEAAPAAASESPATTVPIEPMLRAEPGYAPRKAAGDQARRGLRAMARAVGVTLAESIRAVRTVLARMLPEGMLQREGLFAVPTSVHVGIALLIPLLVVATAVWLYLNNGQAQQYQAALSQAQFEVARGRIAVDAVSARPHWEAALDWLKQADALRPA